MFDHLSALVALGFHTFQLDQEFIAAICQHNPELVEEQKIFNISFSKYELSRKTYRADEYNEDLQRRREREQDTGKYWEGEATGYLKNLRRMYLESDESRHELVELQNYYNRLIADSWNLEVNSQLSNEYLDYALDTPEAREQLTQRLFEKRFSDLGFTHDNKLTRKSMLVYSKPICDDWVFFMAVDRKLLAEPLEKHTTLIRTVSSDGRISRPLGPSFLMVFGVANRKTRKALTFENEQALLLRFEWFLPIRKVPLWSDYSHFFSLRELVAIINMHAKLYRLLSPEFESAVDEALRP